MMMYKKVFYGIVLGLFVVYMFNTTLDIMEIDAAQYASISMEMAQNNSYLEVYHRGKDYLDKPPMVFWINSLSFKLLGFSNIAYKLPALLILLAGLYGLYRFTRIYYTQQIALLATLVLASTQAFFLMTNDVRMDGVFTGFLMLCFWKFATYLKERRIRDMLLSAIFFACALMTKGPLVAIIFIAGFGLHFLIKRQWKNVFSPRWFLFIGVVVLCVLPMCYGLYHQFDLHPEKEVYGLQGPSGLKFFFWTQSFGRITGDIYWDNGLPFHFFLSSILWDMQPWVFCFYPAIIIKLKHLFTKKYTGEYISLGAFIFPFIALSLSRYKLPHYVFPLFPFAAIIVAQFLVNVLDTLKNTKRVIYILQYTVITLLFLVPIVAFVLFFTPKYYHIVIIVVTAVLGVWKFQTIKTSKQKLIYRIFVFTIGFNLILATYLYPNLLPYQSETEAAKYIRKTNPDVSLYTYKCVGHSLDFYRTSITPELKKQDLKTIKKGTWIYTNTKGKKEIDSLFTPTEVKTIKTFGDYHITELSLPFLLKDTREAQLQGTVLLQICTGETAKD